MQVIVSTQWLDQNIENVKVLDASWYLPTENRDTFQEYQSAHIPNAQFFDIDKVADTDNDLPHMIPTADEFSKHVEKMGISNDDTVVVYDTAGLFSAARAWWLFQVMGHQSIFVLDGGFPKWVSEGKAVSDQSISPAKGEFNATLDTSRVATAEQVLVTDSQIIDARPPARFAGEAAEPRPNTRSGHIPNSMNVFFKSMLDENGRLKSEDALVAAFEEAGIDLTKPIVTSCGSGVTAAVLTLGLKRLDHQQTALYDGSWSEWGSRDDLPIATG